MVKRLLSDESGTAIVLFAIVITVLMGICGLVVDVGVVYCEQQKIQNALDAATLAGAQELPDTAAARAKAIEYAVLNGMTEEEIEVIFTNNNRRLVVSSNRSQNLFFMQVFGFKYTNIYAVAAAEPGGPRQAFDYTLFSGSTSDTLRLNGNDLEVVGTTHTNEDFRANGNSIRITGVCQAVGTITTNGNNISVPDRCSGSVYVDMPDYEDAVHAQAQATGQVFGSNMHYNGNNINVNNSIYVDGDTGYR
jgi:Flp pilus assembly protein TadG